MGREGGFTFVEVAVTMVLPGIIGAAATQLVLRLASPMETATRYEQQSLAARAAADYVWDLFRDLEDKPPAECLAPLEETPDEEDYFRLDDEYSFVCRVADEAGYYDYAKDADMRVAGSFGPDVWLVSGGTSVVLEGGARITRHTISLTDAPLKFPPDEEEARTTRLEWHVCWRDCPSAPEPALN